ncbi:MAG: hypothetical protein ACD_16C00013G0002 [uncultured bacterium]|nr:MAG: hypothetical protein ACD_16C00013G0002 [uncultured bacterium]
MRFFTRLRKAPCLAGLKVEKKHKIMGLAMEVHLENWKDIGALKSAMENFNCFF